MAKVKYNKPSIYTVGEVSLIGGMNDVPDNLMEEFLAHPHVKLKIKSGLIVIEGKKEVRTANPNDGKGDQEVGDTTPTVNLDGKKVGEILEALPTVTDLAVLEGLLSHSSAKVQTAALARIEELNAETGDQE